MNPAHRIVAEYARPGDLVRVLHQLRDEGYSQFEVYAPFPSDEIDACLPGGATPIGWIMFAGGALGGGGAYFLQWYAAHDYAYNVGGRPLHSWPSFMPVTFEATVLGAALLGLLGLLWLTQLPRLDHPLFGDARFRRASQDRFFVAIRTDDPRLTRPGLDKLLRASHAVSIQEVEG